MDTESRCYFEAAEERLREATLLHKSSQYSGAAYLAGCAIEAMFWAFVPRDKADGIRGRHDLQILYEAGLGAKFDAVYREQFRVGAKDSVKLLKFEERSRLISKNLTNARLRWNNSYRYYPDSFLRSQVQSDRSLSRGISGDVLKHSVNMLLEVCQYFIALGMQREHWI